MYRYFFIFVLAIILQLDAWVHLIDLIRAENEWLIVNLAYQISNHSNEIFQENLLILAKAFFSFYFKSNIILSFSCKWNLYLFFWSIQEVNQFELMKCLKELKIIYFFHLAYIKVKIFDNWCHFNHRINSQNHETFSK